MKLLALMNSWDQLDIATDTTIAILRGANKLGWQVGYFTIYDLYHSEGEIRANCYDLNHKLIGDELLKLWDVILFRQDPPVNREYLYATQLMDLLKKDNVVVINNPRSVRDFNEKLFILQFPQCIPNSIVSSNKTILTNFWKKEGKVIFKPLHGMAGMGIFLVDNQGTNLPVILDMLTNNGKNYVMAQRYIPEIQKKGDGRILLIGGEPVKHVLSRIPKSGDIRGNIVAGATGKVRLLNERELWICHQVGPKLKQLGLDFVGIDVIGDYLTEINITSPTCAVEIMQAVDEDIVGKFLKYISFLVKV